MTTTTPSTLIEFHIIQSFPVTCLNRDDVGAPKSAKVGGVTRARVSSQCWKRQVRLALHAAGVKTGTRTKQAQRVFAQALKSVGATDEQAEELGTLFASSLTKDTLLFISESESKALAAYAKENDFDPDKVQVKEVAKVVKKAFNPAVDALDIALFGRMVAQDADLKVEACASFNHALSTHEASNEIDFFTALDDLAEDQGSSHLGSLEFNSATYYRYVALDVTQLRTYLDEEQAKEAIAQFTRALYTAVPEARQNTMAGRSDWHFARVLVRQGQPLGVCFDEPVRPALGGGGYNKPSAMKVKTFLEEKEEFAGEEIFAKKAQYDCFAGKDAQGNKGITIPDLITALQSHV